MARLNLNNYYTYNVEGGTVSGGFSIYQARDGFVRLNMGDCVTKLTHQQVLDLHIDVYSLIDFDHDDYIKAYDLGEGGKRNASN